jgi:hypothetical protein
MTRKEQARSASAEVFPQVRAVRKIPLQKTWRKTDLDALNAGPTKGKVSASWTKTTWRGKSGRRQTPNTRQPEANKRPARPRDSPPRPEATLMRLNFFVMDVAGDRHLLRKGDRQEDGKTRWEKYATTQICPRRGHQTTQQPPDAPHPRQQAQDLSKRPNLSQPFFPRVQERKETTDPTRAAKTKQNGKGENGQTHPDGPDTPPNRPEAGQRRTRGAENDQVFF